ncbi:hypothetical protein TIFTF001_019050 [Ficus carica]|uniref:Uncharacterized protein n=1 Tax=Ficus carica TaxID=3494 RepID=A0AA88AWB8_FICCA|nr:hypothetical protein TIFTF001_019050 [Ficus carica]
MSDGSLLVTLTIKLVPSLVVVCTQILLLRPALPTCSISATLRLASSQICRLNTTSCRPHTACHPPPMLSSSPSS